MKLNFLLFKSFALFLCLSLLLGFFGTSSFVLAKEKNEVVETGPVNSFELFWPLVAGKTVDDGFAYSLKRLKENFRGMLIFGKAQKADYSVFLAAKRVLEAEKLINEGKEDLVDKTLMGAVRELEKAEQNINAALSGGGGLGNVGANIANRLSNIEILTSSLLEQRESGGEVLREVLDKTRSVKAKL